MNAAEKILKAKIRLILEQPFFATLALHMNYIEDSNIKRAITNGKEIRFNPAYIETLHIDEVTGVLAHEVMHVAMLHHTRREHRDVQKWNRAADYAINPLLKSAGFVLTDEALVDKAYENKSAEQIYNLLEDAKPPDENSSEENPGGKGKSDTNGGSGKNSTNPNENPGPGDVEDPPSDVSMQEAEATVKDILVQAAMVAKRQDKLSAELERMVQEILKPRICWQEVLARFITEMTKNDYTWKKPSIRYLSQGLYLPTLETEEAGKLILIVDTSVSIDAAMLNQFASEVQDICTTFHVPLQVIYVDSKVQAVQDIEADEPIQLTPKGGGGTDFRPGFDYIEKNDLEPRCVVYLTDGECDDFPKAPDFPVLWAQFGSTDFIPPFGEVLQVCIK